MDQLTAETREQILNTLIPIGYYWLSESNPQATLCIYKWLHPLQMSPKTRTKLDAMKKNWDEMFNQKEDSFSIPDPPYAHQPSYPEDTKLMWVSTNIIMNLLSVTAYEMAYMNLCEITSLWPPFYATLIGMINRSNIKVPFCEWLMMHTMTAFDIMGKDDMQMLGYEIKKIND